jgi:DNA repair protein RadD
VLPTGSGKSHIVAALCKDALQSWPETRILMLTHVKELIEQNAEKMRLHWPGAPMGIYSASIGKRQLGEPITFAGIQSVRSKARQLGHIDLVIIDECHLVNHKDEGGYRTLLADLKAINPALRVVGLTATPYRLGHGLITDKPALFDALIEPVSIEELIFKGYLATLRSKVTRTKLDTSGVHKRGGEYIEAELQAAVDTEENNQRVVREVIELAGDRKAWLIFCAGVQHAENVAEILIENDIPAACVTGETPKKERERILSDFKAGRLRALTNANVLTTGFDHPGIDLIAMLRPTMSAGLYVQMAGRGMRVAEGKADCLVLDFAGVVATHGPITAVQPPKRGGDGNGEAPVKVCDNCGELCHLSLRECPACGAQFPEPERKKLELRDDDIMGLEGQELEVASWMWRKHTSKASGKLMLACTYYGPGLAGAAVTEYLPILHEGYAGDKAMRQLGTMADAAGAYLGGASGMDTDQGLEYMAAQMRSSKPPQRIEYRMDGKFHRVLRRVWA